MHLGLSNEKHFKKCDPCRTFTLQNDPIPAHLPRIYQEHEWNVNNEPGNLCEQSKLFDSDPDGYQLCMKSKLPQAEAGFFKLESSTDNLKLLHFTKDEKETRLHTSYIEQCLADSGSGYWIYRPEAGVSDNSFKSVLVAVGYGSPLYPDGFVNPRTGRRQSFPCGADIAFPDGKQMVSAAASVRITYNPVLRWIKKTAKLV